VKKGETVIWGVAGLISLVAVGMGFVAYNAPPELMPTYQVDSKEAARGELAYRKNGCPSCHKIWNLGSSRGGPLDGVGSRRDQDWLYRYLSSSNPQVMLPSTQKMIYRMPSFAQVAEQDRADMAAFLASLKDRAIEDARAGQASASQEGTP